MQCLLYLVAALLLAVSPVSNSVTAAVPSNGLMFGTFNPAHGHPEARISGFVFTADSDVPLAGVRVTVEGGERSTTTDRRGHFSLSGLTGDRGDFVLVFRRIGYGEARERVGLNGGRSIQIEVRLSPAPLQLDAMTVLLERTRMLGDPQGEVTVPGSAYHLHTADLQGRRLAVDNVHEMLRQIPGMNVQDEEGYGMRPHIGMRGVGAERSGGITLMEDGVLAAPAPYSAPAAYYFPTMGRIDGIEVRKGASQVRYGPRTLGGAVNLISSPIPESRSWYLDGSGGADRLFRTRLRGGDSTERSGWLVEGFQSRTDGFKELESGGDTGFILLDLMAKFRVNSRPGASRHHAFELKVGRQEQTADETYLGLTEEDFRATPNLRYAASAGDVLTTAHTAVVGRYFVELGTRSDLTFTGYRKGFARNWYKLQSVNGQGLSGVLAEPGANPDAFAVLRGAASDDNALWIRANNREYVSRGIQTLVTGRFEGLGASHRLEAGMRLHGDSEDRLQWEDGYRMNSAGRMILTSEGVPGTQDNRRGEASALALHVQDEIRAGRWSLTPGLRWERIEFTRTDWDRNDPDRIEPTQLRKNSVSVLIPGVGVSWEWTPRRHIFAGVHTGFGPPGPGANAGASAEESTNLELGLRVRQAAVGADITAFLSDYDNVLGAATLATGETGTGDLYNGGAVQAWGLEVATDVEVGRGLALPFRIPARFSWSWTQAEFQSSFSSNYGPWGEVNAGDRLPYLPNQSWSGSLGFEGGRWDGSLEWSGASAMRTEAGRGAIAAGEGADQYNVFHLNLARDFGLRGTLYAGVQNLLDKTYVVSRRPAGARPGLPRTLFAGYRISR